MALTRKEKLEKLRKISKPDNPNAEWRKIAKWNRDHAESIDDFIRIAVHIAQALKAKSSNQTILAEQLGVTPQALTRIMKGRQNLSLQTIRKIEKVLDISLVTVHHHTSGVETSQSHSRKYKKVLVHLGVKDFSFDKSTRILWERSDSIKVGDSSSEMAIPERRKIAS